MMLWKMSDRLNPTDRKIYIAFCRSDRPLSAAEAARLAGVKTGTTTQICGQLCYRGWLTAIARPGVTNELIYKPNRFRDLVTCRPWNAAMANELRQVSA